MPATVFKKNIRANSLKIYSTKEDALHIKGGAYVGKDMYVSNNVTAKYFFGNGSKLTNTDKWSVNGNDLYYNYGNVSIGTNASGYSLLVNGSMYVSDDVYTSKLIVKDDKFEIKVNNSTKLYIDNNKKYIGFNTINPSSTLDINGSVQIDGNVIVNGNLLVNGNKTSITTNDYIVNNSLIIISNNNKSENSGIIINKDTYKLGLIWDELNDEFIFINGSNITENQIDINNYLDLKCGEIYANDSIIANYIYGNGSKLKNVVLDYTKKFDVSIIDGKIGIDNIKQEQIFLVRGHKYIFNLNIDNNSDFNILYSNNTIFNEGITKTNNQLIFIVPDNISCNIKYDSLITSNIGNDILISDTILYNSDKSTYIKVNDDNINFVVNNESKMIIKNNKIGINTLEPNELLDINSTLNIDGNITVLGNITNIGDIYTNELEINRLEINDTIIIENNTLNIDNINCSEIIADEIYTNINGSQVLLNRWKGLEDIYIMDTNVGIGVENPTSRLHVGNGTVNITGVLNVDKIILEGIQLNAISDTIWDKYEPNKDLISHWQFNEGKGTILYDNIKTTNNHGILTGGNWTNGKINNTSLNFDGISNYITISNSIENNLANNNFTISTWIKTDVSNEDRNILTIGNTYNNDIIEFKINSTNYFEYKENDESLLSTSLINTNNWIHILITKLNNDVKLYINNNFESNKTFNTIINPRNIKFGVRFRYNEQLSQFWKGSIDSTRIYNNIISNRTLLYETNNIGSELLNSLTYTDGNVGIGVENPEYDLDVNGNISATNFIGDASMVTDVIPSKWHENNNNIYFIGNVGIGVSNPRERLDINGSIIIGNTSNNVNGTIRYTGDDFEGCINNTWVSLTTNNKPKRLWKIDENQTIYYLDGNVGIGTDNPEHTLDVRGDINIIGNWYINNTKVLPTVDEFNILKGALVTTEELNILDGINVYTDELNYLANTTPGIIQPNKAIILGENKNLNFNNGSLTVNDLIVNDLIVEGNEIIIYSNNIEINDSIIKLSSNHIGTPTRDTGFILLKESNENIGLIWDENNNEFAFIKTNNNGTILNNNININSYTDLHVDNLNIENNLTAINLEGDGFNLTNVVSEYLQKFIVTININGILINNNLKPKLLLAKGHKYIFDISQIDNSHQFGIYRSNGEQYNEGIEYINNNNIIFNISLNAPTDLSYECGNHLFNEGNKIDILGNIISNNNSSTYVNVNENGSINFVVNNSNIIKIYNNKIGIKKDPINTLDINDTLIINGDILTNENNTNSIYINNNSYINNIYVNDKIISNNKTILYKENNDVILKNINTINANNIYTNDVIIIENNESISLNRWQSNNDNIYTYNNIGIGTNNPQFPLVVNGTAKIEGNLTVNKLVIKGKEVTAEPEVIWQNGTNNNIYYNNGYVGIGTNNPQYELDVIGTVNATYYYGDASLLTGLTESVWLENNSNIYYLEGNVGIGVTNPRTKLEIGGGIIIGNTSNEINGTIRYTGDDFEGYINNEWISLTNNYRPATLWNNFTNYISYTEGNVGIGTNNPQYDLDVNGNVTILGNITINNTLLLASINDLNSIKGINVTSDEINIFNNIIATTKELNYLSNVIPGVGIEEKVLIINNNSLNISNCNLSIYDLNINGNLSVSGDIISFESENLIVNDSVLVLSHNNNINDDAGFIIKKDDYNVGFIWDNSNNEFALIKTFSNNTNNIDIIDYESLYVGNITSYGNITANKFYGNGSLLTDIPYESKPKWIQENNLLYYLDGNVGIGTTNPQYELDINGTLEIDINNNDINLDNIYINGSTNYIGINNNNPSTSLDINGTLMVNDSILIGEYNNPNNYKLLVNLQNQDMSFKSNNNNILYINGSTNNIGINTNNPQYTLDINGSLYVNGSISIGYNGIINENESLVVNGSIYANNYIGNGSLLTNMSWTILDNNNIYYNGSYVGIGTNNPKYSLDVNGSIYANNYIGNGSQLTGLPWILENNTLSIFNKKVGINNENPEYDLDVNGTINAKEFIGDGSLISNVDKWENNNDSLYYLEGNVGIGTNTPNAKLEVNGSVKININNSEFINIQNDNNSILFVNGTNGFIGIGTTNPESKLHIKNGNILVTNGSFIDDSITVVPDYVFEEDYKLMDISELETYIKTYKHLPNIDSEEEIINNGLNLGEFSMKLLEKIEELFLYKINQYNEIESLNNEYNDIDNQITEIQNKINNLNYS